MLRRAGLPRVNGGDGDLVALETHSITVDHELGQKAETLRVDTREGGRIEEVLEDGSTLDWGGVVLGATSPGGVRMEAERPPYPPDRGGGAVFS
jgi:hypothetical protein